jgi:hypothetical protein
MATFPLKLQKTYYDKGFFNVTVDYHNYVRPDSGPVTLVLANTGQTIAGRVSREANPNGTPRVFGGIELRDWFQENFRFLDTVNIDLVSNDRMILRTKRS